MTDSVGLLNCIVEKFVTSEFWFDPVTAEIYFDGGGDPGTEVEDRLVWMESGTVDGFVEIVAPRLAELATTELEDSTNIE